MYAREFVGGRVEGRKNGEKAKICKQLKTRKFKTNTRVRIDIFKPETPKY